MLKKWVRVSLVRATHRDSQPSTESGEICVGIRMLRKLHRASSNDLQNAKGRQVHKCAVGDDGNGVILQRSTDESQLAGV